MDGITVGRLVTSREQTRAGVRVREVAERFFRENGLDAVAIVDCGEPVGLVCRNKLLFTLFRRFGFELYERKPIITITATEPLVIHEGESIDVALDKALARPFQDIYDDIVVVDDADRFKGLLSVKGVIIEQSNALANSIVQKELANSRAEELEKVNRVKSQFIANVTHELRAPVNAIIGLAELLKISCDKGYTEQMVDRLTLMLSSAVGLRAIITNILDLSKVEAGKMEVIIDRFDVTATVREVAETTKILLGKKPVEVSVVFREEPFMVESDPVKFRQILVNLTSNAAKFTEEGRITISAARDGAFLTVEVSDTGIGIKETDMQNLFSAFTQIEDARTKRYEGTGLGLTITRSLVDLLGGKVTLSSRFGEGSAFTVRIPIGKHEN